MDNRLFLSLAKWALLLTLTAATPLVLTGCDEGPMEEAGEKIDDAADDVKDAAEDAADDVEDGIDG